MKEVSGNSFPSFFEKTSEAHLKNLWRKSVKIPFPKKEKCFVCALAEASKQKVVLSNSPLPKHKSTFEETLSAEQDIKTHFVLFDPLEP